MPETATGQDFIVSELLSELKDSNVRKDQQIRELHSIIIKLVVGSLVAILLVVSGFLMYLNQYDFVDYTTQSAEGVYAIIDSAGNVVGHDLTSEQIEKVLRGASDGES